jgi:hypothetical protein
MKLATLTCLAALCLLAPGAVAAPGDPVPAEPPRKEQGALPQRPAPGRAESPSPRNEAKGEGSRQETRQETRPDARQDAARAERPASAPVVGRERRRRSYAACNRASHQRDYRGGRRRRFLIRCRLGYERTRLPSQHQAPTPTTPPARKP